MSPPNERETAFVQFLQQLAGERNRGALAALRRGLGKRPGEAPEVYPYVVPWLGQRPSASDERAFFLVASLFSLHPKGWQQADGRGPTNLGASFALLRDGKHDASIERRFTALLNAHPDDLAEHLRHGVGLLKSKEAPIDWPQLLHDIRGWDWEGRPVQREWARAFWRQPPPISSATGAVSPVEGEVEHTKPAETAFE